MVALCLELWFNRDMMKSEAIDLLGGELSAAADAMDISYQAVSKWPDVLPRRISDRVLGACTRRGIDIPLQFLEGEPNPHPALVAPAQAATETVAGVAHA